MIARARTGPAPAATANARTLRSKMLAASTAAIAIAAGLNGTQAMAQATPVDTEWTGTASPNWQQGANWSRGVPDDPTTASVDVAGANAPVIDAGIMALANAIFVGRLSDGLLTIRNGGVLRVRAARIGEFSGSRGRILVTGASSRFAFIEADLVVGNAGNGELLVAEAALVEGRNVQIGGRTGGEGLVTITGIGSRLTTLQLQTGFGGNGTLRIQNGGLAETEANFVGSQAGAIGRVFVDGSGSRWRSTMQSNIGVLGRGEVSLTNGATAQGQQTSLGLQSGGDGRLTIEHAGSLFEAQATRIGDAGSGTITVRDGGRFTASNVEMGVQQGAVGNVLVNGSGSRFTASSLDVGVASGGSGTIEARGGGEIVTNFLSLGDRGTAALAINSGGVLRITGGGAATIEDNSVFGRHAGSAGTVVINGAGSALISDRAELLTVGRRGAAMVSIANGGRMETRALGVGTSNGGDGQITVDGAGSTLRVTAQTIYVGTSNARQISGNTVIEPEGGTGSITVRNGALFDAPSGFFGIGAFDPLSSGNVTISGAGSLLNSGGLVVSRSGILRIEAGAIARNSGGFGSLFTFAGSQVLVTGAGSLLANRSAATVNGTLSVANGAQVDASRLAIGQVCVTGCNAATVLTAPLVRIDGAGSQIRLSGAATINTTDSFLGTLEVNNGGVLAIGEVDGGIARAAGSLFAARAILTGGAIIFNHIDAGFDFRTAIQGTGSLTVRSGTTLLSGTHSFTGLTAIRGGALIVNGTLINSPITVANGGVLGGSGRVSQTVAVGDGTISPGNVGVGTLTVGALQLTSSSVLDYQLGSPAGANDLISVIGNLTLDGSLNVTDVGGFGAGVYRLITYGGALTDNGLIVGPLPNGSAGLIQTSVANQVNLVVSAAASPLSFWDGAGTAGNGVVNGGSGVWSFANTNWTGIAGNANGIWGEGFAVFQGTPGTVSIDNSAGNISATGIQFAVNGYRIEGGPLVLFAPATIRVGDGTAAGAGYTATIASVIAGNDVGIVKTDLGTLVLSGTNTYTVGTTINAGTVSVSRDANLGDSTAVVTFNGGALRVTAPILTAREWRIAPGGGVFDAGVNAFTHNGGLTGSGTLRSVGTGIWTHSGDATAFAGRLELAAGRLNLSGRIGGTTVVSAGAILSGTGTLGNLDLAGTLAPGNSPGTLTTTGDVIFRAGSTYQVELLANGMGDRINAGGRAVIEGGTVVITATDPARNYNNGSLFRILNATGGRTGTFAGITGSSAFLDFSLLYDATGADVRVEVIRQFPDVARSFNQRQTATGLRDLDLTIGADSAAVYRAILFLDADPARASFDASSGEVYASTMAAGHRQGAALTGRMTARAHDRAAPGWRLFGGVVGDAGSVSTDGNGGRFAYDDIGSILGIDYRGTDDGWAIGFGGGTSNGAVTLPVRTSRARLNGWQVGAYVRLGASDEGANATFSIAHNDADARVTRQINVADLSRTSSGRTDVRTTAYAANLRYGFVRNAVSYGPVATIVRQQTRLGRFAETGAGSLNLTSNGSEDNRTHYGTGGFVRLADARGTIDAAARLVWGERDTVRTNLVLDGAAGTPFQVQAARGSEFLGLYTLAGDYGLGGGWSIGGDLRATYGQSERSVAGSATVRLVF